MLLTRTSITFLTVLLISCQAVRAKFDVSTCGKTKGCMFAPEGCEKKKDCIFKFSYKPDGEELEIEIEGKPSSANGYVAIGFSEDPKMGNDLVVFCARFGDAVKGGLARTTQIVNNSGVQTIVSATKEDDAINCVIRQVKKSEDRPELFDLGGSYYILFARGPYVEKNGTAMIQNHTPQGRYIGKKVSLADVSVGGANTAEDGGDEKEETEKPDDKEPPDDDDDGKDSEWSTCGKKKGCVFAPEGCEKTKDCIFRFSYKPDGDELEMEIEGKPSSANGYVAIGFSEDPKMGNDLVVFCARFGDSVKGGLARTVKPTHVVNNTGVQTIVSATKKDDFIKCVIRQVKKPEDRPELFDLGGSYYILFARGPYVETNDTAKLQNHTPQGRYVGKKVSLADVTVGSTNTTKDGGDEKEETEKPDGEPHKDDDNGQEDSDWSTCGTKKGCVFAPEGCEKKNECTFHFSYKPDGEELEMEIEGEPSSANGYVAVGFSEDPKMGNDMVVFCARFGDTVKGGLARNVKPPRVENNTGVQTVVSATKKGGLIRCVIRQVKKPEDRPELFDLGGSYYILFARGPYVEKDGKGEIQNHTPQGRYVGKKVSLADVTGGGTKGDDGKKPSEDGDKGKDSEWSTCGTKKGCVFAPEGCEKKNDCIFRFSYKPDGDELEMEIEGTPSSANGYVAVGFSEDQKMGNDMVVFCARFNNAVKGGLARNVRPPRVENNTGVQTIVSATTQGDAIKCVIRQVIKPEDRPELFDLSLSYYILFARGPYVEKDGKAEIQNHTPQGRYVGKEVSLADVTGRGTNTTGDGDEPKPESTDTPKPAAEGGKETTKSSQTKSGAISAVEFNVMTIIFMFTHWLLI